MDAKPEPKFANLTRDAYKGDLVGLFAAGEQVESIMAHPGWEAITRVVERDRADIEAKLNGVLASRADYAYWTSRRAALNAFQDAAHAIVAVAAKTRADQERKHESTAETVG